MELDELRKKQIEFKGKWDHELKKKYIELEKLRQRFVRKFSPENVSKMNIDDYVIGKGDHHSFCYEMEIALIDLGNIKGATAFKFGVYYGRTKTEPDHQYRFHEKWGRNEEEAFKNVKNEILKLIKSGENGDTEAMEQSMLTPMFKGKIMSIYFPNKYINMFSSEFLNYYLNKLDIDFSVKINEIKKRELISSFKHDDLIMREWSVFQFVEFLYFIFGKPSDLSDAPQELIKYNVPNLSEVKPSEVIVKVIDFVNSSKEPGYDVSGNKIVKKRDYLEEHKRNKKTGDRGELIVLKYEKEFLIKNKRVGLARKIKHIAQETDCAGYDILSYDIEGNEKHIEVKASLNDNIESVRFMISSAELDMSKIINNYYLYYIFGVNSKIPKIIILKEPFKTGKQVNLRPIGYRAKINIETINE